MFDFSFFEKKAALMSDSELYYSAKDAHKAARVMQSIGNNEKECHYLDEVNVYCNEMNERKKQ